MVSFDSIREKLKESGIASSVQRVKVLEYLHECKCHPTADRIYGELSKNGLDISLATVYNTLNLFEEKGLIRILSLEGSENRYDIMTHDHGHFICEECGSIMNFEVDLNSSVYLYDESLSDFKVKKRDVYFRGICPECIEKEKGKEK